MKEIWSPVKGYEGLYEVSNLGNVRSLSYHQTGKKRILSTSVVRGGYLRVELTKNGKRKMFLIHRLVAEAFIPNWCEEAHINHIDENTQNNNVDNLEWCDAKYNNNYGSRIKRVSEKNTNGKLSKPVIQYTKTGKFVCEWPSMSEAERNGFSQGKISLCCNGKQESHKGYIWKYKE